MEKPRLSRVIEERGQETGDRGQKQTAYQVLVASTPELLAKDQGDLRDSGKVASDQSIQVEYFLIQYLQETGRNDLLYTIFNQETHPGWGHMLAQGATTFWEQWNGFMA